ncbi:MAG TPA: cupin-like domain-containing protein, partial [Bacteroidia bacterium]|nr:cupin-like domain-containing protein [Bacteroidia bacterium]
MDLSQKIDVVHYNDGNKFKAYLHSQTPVIIKGLASNTPAGKKWSIDYFKKTMGDLLMDVYDNGNTKAAASAYTAADLKMKFKDYLDIIEKDEHTDLRIFLCDLFKLNPELRKEYPCPEVFKGLLDHKGFMFFGGKDTTVRIHYDIDMSNVLHTHFGGKKKVLLFAPEYSKYLYRLPFNTYSLVNFDNPDYKK